MPVRTISEEEYRELVNLKRSVEERRDIEQEHEQWQRQKREAWNKQVVENFRTRGESGKSMNFTD